MSLSAQKTQKRRTNSVNKKRAVFATAKNCLTLKVVFTLWVELWVELWVLVWVDLWVINRNFRQQQAKNGEKHESTEVGEKPIKIRLLSP